MEASATPQGWITTRKGRVLYSRSPRVFTSKACLRIIKYSKRDSWDYEDLNRQKFNVRQNLFEIYKLIADWLEVGYKSDLKEEKVLDLTLIEQLDQIIREITFNLMVEIIEKVPFIPNDLEDQLAYTIIQTIRAVISRVFYALGFIIDVESFPDYTDINWRELLWSQ